MGKYLGSVCYWKQSDRGDIRAAKLADRHYSRQTPGARQFAPPGKAIVLLGINDDALWVTISQKFTKHKWPDSWVCSLFRNESRFLSSDMILQAVAITSWQWGHPPKNGLITFIDSTKVKPKRNFGYCFLKAGFEVVGYTKINKLITLQMPPEKILEIEPLACNGQQLALFCNGG